LLNMCGTSITRRIFNTNRYYFSVWL